MNSFAWAGRSASGSYILDNHFITDSQTGGHVLTLGSLLLEAKSEGKNNLFKASLLASHGGHSPTREVGDAQILSNIDTEGVEAIKIYELYVGRKKGGSVVTLGWRDLSQDFNVTPPALSFINSSFGTSAEFGAAGFRGPGIYPFVSFGGHFLFQQSSPLYLAGALVDPISPRYHYPKQLRSHILLNQDNYMGLLEAGLHQESRYQIAVGTWNMNIAEFESFPEFQQYGSYVQGFVELGAGWNPFARFGQASRVQGALLSNLVYGIQKTGVFMKTDEFGVGHTKALIFGSQTPEEISEMFYQFPLIPGLRFLLSHQFIVNPAFASSDAQVFTLRMMITPKI